MNLNSPRQMDETWTAKARLTMDIVLPNQTDPISITAIISSSLKNECLLGWQDLIKLGIIPKTFPFAPSKHTHIVQAIQSAPASHADRISISIGSIHCYYLQYRAPTSNERTTRVHQSEQET